MVAPNNDGKNMKSPIDFNKQPEIWGEGMNNWARELKDGLYAIGGYVYRVVNHKGYSTGIKSKEWKYG